MKLRIADNSVRLRLGRSEVAQLASTGSVESQLTFGPESVLTYRLLADPQISVPHAHIADGLIQISIPTSIAHRWSTNEEIAVSGLQETGAREPLTILVEKDFQCLHKEDEPHPDTYPNPAMQLS